MSRVAEAIRELRQKYGLDPQTGLPPERPAPVIQSEPVIVVDRFIEPPRRKTPWTRSA